MTEIERYVDDDPHAHRLVAWHANEQLTVLQIVRLALAVGRLQGHYMSANQLADDAGLVVQFNNRPREDVLCGK